VKEKIVTKNRAAIMAAGATLLLALPAFPLASAATAAPRNAKKAPKTAVKKPAAPAKTAAKIPYTAEQILDKTADATGGRAAIAKIQTLVMNGTMDMKAQGLTGKVETYLKAPNKFLMAATIPGIGEMRQAFDGTTGWAQDPFTGVRTLQGPELALLRRTASLEGAINWRTLYAKVEVVGTSKVNGRDAYVVKLTPRGTGPNVQPVTQYHDAQTFLPVRLDTVVQSPQGTFPTESYLSDYRSVEGLKMPFKLRQVVGGIAEIVTTFSEARVNVPVEEAKFARPPATTTTPPDTTGVVPPPAAPPVPGTP
jgi:hypothetical protein